MFPSVPKTAHNGFAIGLIFPEHFQRGVGAVKLFRVLAVDVRRKVDHAVFVFPARADPAPDKTVKGFCCAAVGVFLRVAGSKVFSLKLIA